MPAGNIGTIAVTGTITTGSSHMLSDFASSIADNRYYSIGAIEGITLLYCSTLVVSV